MKWGARPWRLCTVQAALGGMLLLGGSVAPAWGAEPAKSPDAGLPLPRATLSDADVKTIAALHGANLAAIDIATRAKAWAATSEVKALADEVRRTRVALDQRLINLAADSHVPLSALLPGAEQREANLIVAPVDEMAGHDRRPPQEKDLVRVIEGRCAADAEAARRSGGEATHQGLSAALEEMSEQLDANRRAAAELLVKLDGPASSP